MHNVQGGGRGSLAVRRPLVWLGATAALTLILDQFTKALVRSSLVLNEAFPLIPGLFDIARVENTGAAFGMLPGRRPLFITVSLLMLLSVAVYWWRARPKAWPVVIALGLVVGGAIGNLIDRAFIGRVTDFLAFSFFSPVFNLADSAIFVGVFVLVVWILFGPQPSVLDDEIPGPELGEQETAPGSVGNETLGDVRQ